ncbi:MAG: relaxase/mobilization nuclease domain-containing protein [Allosphingosinicella sp.]|uniref:relaxase/mobilization nuclease domain-containing protein n=1 Tax=Allosphingosinicella sp. TaxID=2823234 RepID=UPI003962D0D7
MIAKLIRMKQNQRRSAVRPLRDNVFALTRYIVDSDPYRLIADIGHDVVSLSDYALAVEAAGIEPGEKVEAFGARNLIGKDLADWQAQMLAVAARAPRIKSPVIHVILSLQEGEAWTDEQREEAITIVLETLRLERCQVVWAEHSNTSNPHLHLSIVRVDPLTGKKAGSDWLVDDLHQSLALVEERQGRAREPGALYVARGRAVYDADTDIMVRDADGHFVKGWYKALDRKHNRTPPEMRPLRASMIAAADQAQSWSELHAAFEEIGIAYDRAGSGARMSHRGVSVIASEIHATLSRSRLEERLGPFEPDLSRLNSDYEAYRNAFGEQLKMLRVSRDAERRRLKEWTMASTASLSSDAAKAVARSIEAEANAADACIVDAFRQAIARCTKHRMTEQEWKEAGEPTAPPPLISPNLLLPREVNGVEQAWEASSACTRSEKGWATEYRSPDKALLFTDHRIVIVVHATDRRDGIDEALRIAAARWGSVRARGSEPYLQLVAERAAKLGVKVVDADGMPLTLSKNVAEQTPPLASTQKPDPFTHAKGGPELTDDPIREMRIDQAISYLQNFNGLLLRRRGMAGDTAEFGRSGPLEIVLNDDKFDNRNELLEQHAMFDDHPRVQAFLEQKRQEMLETWRLLLLGSSTSPFGLTPKEAHKTLHGKIRRPAFIAAQDSDYIEMLEQVRLIRNQIETGRKPSTKLATSTSPPERSKSLIQEEPEVGRGVPIDVQTAFKRREQGMEQ